MEGLVIQVLPKLQTLGCWRFRQGIEILFEALTSKFLIPLLLFQLLFLSSNPIRQMK